MTTSKFPDLVEIYSATSGVGAFTLGAAVPGFRGTEALEDGQKYSYSVQNSSAYEVGRGTYVAATSSFIRTVIESSNNGNPVNFSAGVKISFTILSSDIDEIVNAVGQPGPPGKSAYRVAQDNGFQGTEEQWLASLVGPAGQTAYQIALNNGFVGTQAQWLASLVGAPGKSAYQTAVDNGFQGTQAQWLASLVGKSAYQVAVDNGFSGTQSQWIASLKGDKGDVGKSAYQVALDNGFVGTQPQWLASLKGDKGDSAYQVALNNGFVGTQAEWLASLKGAQGDSAYQVAVANGYQGTQVQWIASLKGDKGDSAYQVAVANGYQGTQAQWLASLVGAAGQDALTLYLTSAVLLLSANADGTLKTALPADAGVLTLYRGTNKLSLVPYTVNVLSGAGVTAVYDNSDATNPHVRITALTADTASYTVNVIDQASGNVLVSRTYAVNRVRDGVAAISVTTDQPLIPIAYTGAGVVKSPYPINAGSISVTQNGKAVSLANAAVAITTQTNCAVTYDAGANAFSMTATTADKGLFKFTVTFPGMDPISRTVLFQRVYDGKDGSNRTPGQMFETTRYEASQWAAGYALETVANVYFQSAYPAVFATVGNAGSSATDSFKLNEKIANNLMYAGAARSTLRSSMIYFKNYYYILSTDTSNTNRLSVLRSPTGIAGSFTRFLTPTGGATYPNNYAAGFGVTDGNTLLIVSSSTTKVLVITATTIDPTTWSTASDKTTQIHPTAQVTPLFAKYRNGVSVIGGFTSAANDRMMVAYSTDMGANWTRCVTPATSTGEVYDVEWDARTNLWYACGNAGLVMTAPPLANGAPGAWTVKPAVAPQTLNAIAVQATNIVFLGDQGRMVLTADGTTYTSSIFESAIATVDSIVKAGNSWVVLCTSNAIDGRTRILVTTDFTSAVYRYYDDGTFPGTVVNASLMNGKVFFFETATGNPQGSVASPWLVVSQSLDVDPNTQFVMPNWPANNPAFGRYIKA